MSLRDLLLRPQPHDCLLVASEAARVNLAAARARLMLDGGSELDVMAAADAYSDLMEATARAHACQPAVCVRSWGFDRACTMLLRAGARLACALIESNQERRQALLLEAGKQVSFAKNWDPPRSTTPLAIREHARVLCGPAFRARARCLEMMVHAELLGADGSVSRDGWLVAAGWRAVHGACMEVSPMLREWGDVAAADAAALLAQESVVQAYRCAAEARFKRTEFVEAWALASAAAAARPDDQGLAKRAAELGAAATSVQSGARLPTVSPGSFLPLPAVLPPIHFTV